MSKVRYGEKVIAVAENEVLLALIAVNAAVVGSLTLIVRVMLKRIEGHVNGVETEVGYEPDIEHTSLARRTLNIERRLVTHHEAMLDGFARNADDHRVMNHRLNRIERHATPPDEGDPTWTP